MFRLLADENFNNDIVRGLLLRRPDLELRRAQDVGLTRMDDPSVLEWAAADGFIILTHDRRTMPPYAYERVAAGSDMPGLFVLSDRLAVGTAVGELHLIVECSRPQEWADRDLSAASVKR